MTPRATYGRASWAFRRLLGCVYLAAFGSLLVQLRGLLGHDGISPATVLMASAAQWADGRGLGPLGRFLSLPTVFWLGAGDRALQLVCGAGVALAALLAGGVLPAVVLPVLWLFYLSLSVVGGDFLSYQWDGLLLEAGFLAVFIAPVRWLDSLRRVEDPPRVARWLLWFLLFRLMFTSGVVKLASGDPTWRGLTALAVHYETQPLPTPLGWYAHQLPRAFQVLSTALVLIVELAVPWLIFSPRLMRLAGCGALAGLQLLIALTGNYAFFNLLTVALCVLLLDDGVFEGRWHGVDSLQPAGSSRYALPIRLWHVAAPVAAAALTLPAAAVILLGQLGLSVPGAERLLPLDEVVAPFRSVNIYGLFAVMTTARDEIVVEGSSDGETWAPDQFRYKPGDVRRPPPWVGPHQPRLDWQMWFAALERYEDVPWFRGFCLRLLQGSPSVVALLANNPFPRQPPRFVRATRYRYHFSSSSVRRRDGAWWVREEIGPYSPVLSLRQ